MLVSGLGERKTGVDHHVAMYMSVIMVNNSSVLEETDSEFVVVVVVLLPFQG